MAERGKISAELKFSIGSEVVRVFADYPYEVSEARENAADVAKRFLLTCSLPMTRSDVVDALADAITRRVVGKRSTVSIDLEEVEDDVDSVNTRNFTEALVVRSAIEEFASGQTGAFTHDEFEDFFRETDFGRSFEISGKRLSKLVCRLYMRNQANPPILCRSNPGGRTLLNWAGEKGDWERVKDENGNVVDWKPTPSLRRRIYGET